MDLGHITQKLSDQYTKGKGLVIGTLLAATVAVPAQGQDITENHVHGQRIGTNQAVTFSEDPDYSLSEGLDGEQGTIDDEHFPGNTYVANSQFLGDGKNLYGQERDSELPAMGSSPSTSTPLPVELANTEIYTENNRATLQWKTLSETNNAGFTIYERTEDGDLQEISSVEGAGTTNEPQQYTATDNDLSNNPNTLEYEIRQVDLDGTNEVVAQLTAENPYRGNLGVTSYPNPTNGQVNLDMTFEEGTQQATVEVYDMLGRRISQNQYDLQDGQLETQKDLSNLSSGTYFLRAKTDDEQYNTRITVTK